MINQSNIILIGPMASGKTAIGNEISYITGYKYTPIDKLKWYYRFQNGYDLVKSQAILRSQGFEALLEYAKPYFTSKDLKELLNQFTGIIELGATDTHSNDLSTIKTINEVLTPYPNIFLILPYDDEELSKSELRKRLIERYKTDSLKKPILSTYIKKNEEFLVSPQNALVAKHIIYCNDRTVHQIAETIISKSELGNKSLKLSANFLNPME